MKKILCFLLLVVALTGCTFNESDNKMNDNEYFSTMFNIDDIDINLYGISYEEMDSMINDQQFTGMVLVIREDCEYCHELFSLITEKSNEIAKNSEISLYIIESNKMESDVKFEFANQFGVTSVPTMLYFESGTIKITEIGVPTDERLDELMEMCLET